MPTKKIETLDRTRVPAMEKILGKPFKVLDDGFVRVIDYMGNDRSIVQAARVSYGAGTKTVSQDRELIRYLIRHRHTSPFEMCEIKLHVRVPMDCWRQWIRHRTASVNEYSTRYSEAINSMQRTRPEEWRHQSKSNKQASEGFAEPPLGKILTAKEKEIQDLARDIYNERIGEGIAREQARKDLPLSTYTEAYWKIDLHNLVHFLNLRLDPTAQIEIRKYAGVIGDKIVRRWCPLTWEAFRDYRLNAMELSSHDQAVIAAIARGNIEEALSKAVKHDLLIRKKNGFKPTLEGRELEAKLKALDLDIPWKS